MINMVDGALKPEPCDHVFEAEYCIKSTSLESNILIQTNFKVALVALIIIYNLRSSSWFHYWF